VTCTQCVDLCAQYLGRFPYNVLPARSSYGSWWVPVRQTYHGRGLPSTWSDAGPAVEEIRYDHANATTLGRMTRGVFGIDAEAVYGGLTLTEAAALCEARQELCAWRERLGG
jgi:hypothetical protein